MNDNFKIRLITPDDAVAALHVYKPYVETTAITFEYEVPSAEEFKRRINSITPEYPWLVCERGNTILGYAYAHKHRERTAYQWSPESTIYLSNEAKGTGVARVLYETLFGILAVQGFVNVYAGVLSANIASNKFHRAMGFEEIGLFKNIGYKLGKWHSNNWYQKHLQPHPEHPDIPVQLKDMVKTGGLDEIIVSANTRLTNCITLKGNEGNSERELTTIRKNNSKNTE